MEIWRDIKGYDGYQVSSLGRIRSHNKVTSNAKCSVRRWKDRIIKPHDSCADGRLRVILWKDRKAVTLLVHRLQAIAFIGEPPSPNMTVNHKDGNPQNNVPNNLEWVSRGDNIRYGFANDQYSNKCRKTILVDEQGNKHEFRSQAQASRWLGHNVGYINTQLRCGSGVLRNAANQIFNIEAE